MLNYKFGKEKHIFITEKSTQKLYIYSNYHHKPIYSFGITTGKKTGQKYFEGDLKTPEGIYYFRRTLSGDELPKTDDYGEKAFTMNFPNPIDKLEDRKGSGIWLHGAFDISKVNTARSSRGCIVMNNTDLNTVSKYVFLNDTPIFVYKTIPFEDVDTIKKKRDAFLNQLRGWKSAWEKKELTEYIQHYSDTFRYRKMNLREFREYKQRLNRNYRFIRVKLSDITFYHYQNYYFASFNQLYVSDKNHFYSKKIQYWKSIDARPQIAYERSIPKSAINKIEVSKGNYVSINQFRRSILKKLEQDRFQIQPHNIYLDRIEKDANRVTLSIKNGNSDSRLKAIPVLLLKKESESIYRSLDTVSLKNGVPQEIEKAISLDNRRTAITIPTEKGYDINSASLFIFDERNNFKQILTYFVKNPKS